MADPRKDEQPEDAEFLPDVEFGSIVFPFYTQALVKLGLIENPATGRAEENLEFAKRLIDLLDLLKARTEGRLEPDEDKLLESCLGQLKAHYLRKANILKT